MHATLVHRRWINNIVLCSSSYTGTVTNTGILCHYIISYPGILCHYIIFLLLGGRKEDYRYPHDSGGILQIAAPKMKLFLSSEQTDITGTLCVIYFWSAIIAIHLIVMERDSAGGLFCQLLILSARAINNSMHLLV